MQQDKAVQQADLFEQKHQNIPGLTPIQRQQSAEVHGENRVALKEASLLKSLGKRLWGPTPWLLEAAIIFELVLGKYLQSALVLGLLLFSAIDGEIQERRARKVLHQVRTDLVPICRLKIQNQWRNTPSDQLVVGDIIHLRTGDIVPADVKIHIGVLRIDQSALTGETEAITKSKHSTVPAASTVVSGEAIAYVSDVGAASSYGQTITLAQQAEVPGGLEKLLFTVVRYLAYLDAVLIIILVGTAYFKATPWQILLPFIAVLIIATIPVSMPASFTVANAVEAQVLAKKRSWQRA